MATMMPNKKKKVAQKSKALTSADLRILCLRAVDLNDVQYLETTQLQIGYPTHSTQDEVRQKLRSLLHRLALNKKKAPTVGKDMPSQIPYSVGYTLDRVEPDGKYTAGKEGAEKTFDPLKSPEFINWICT